MLGINCLLKHADILPKIAQLVEYTANGLIEEGGDADPSAPVQAVYNSLRKAGLEVDFQTVANLYRDTLDLENPAFTSSDEIDKMLMTDINKRVNIAAQKILEIGKNAPANEAVNRIIDTIQQVGKVPAVKTVQKEMQDRLVGAARKILSESEEGKEILKKNQEPTDPYEYLKSALMIQKNNKFGDFGYMKTAMDLFEDFKKQMVEVADTLADNDAYASEQIKIAADVIANSSYQLMLTKSESRKVLNKALKEAGYTRVNSNGSVVLDWNTVLRNGRDVIGSVRKVLGESGFSEDELDNIMEALESEYNFLLEAKIAKELSDKGMNHGQLGKLANLAVNNPGAFNNAENNELLKGLGIPMADREAIKSVRDIMQMYNVVMQGSPIASYATTYINTIERHIRNMLGKAIESSDNTSKVLKLARWFQLSSQYAQTTILSNPGNVIENFFSGVGTVVDAAFSNPQHFMRLFEAGLASGKSVATGGVRVGRENTNPNSHHVNLEDRTSGHYGKTAKWFFNQWQRLSLSATDSMFGQYVMSSVELRIIRFLLKTKAGMSTSEANKVINDMYYSNSKELDDMAEFLISQYDKLGLKFNRVAEKKRLVNDMYISNFLSDGTVWASMLNKYTASGNAIEMAIGKKMQNSPIRHDLLLKMRNAADAVRGKAMGHRSDTLLGRGIEKLYNFSIEKHIDSAKEKGQQRKQAFLEFVRGGLGNALFARRGSLNWAFLILQKSTGMGLLSTLVFDIGLTKMGINFGGNSFMTSGKAKEYYALMESASKQEDLNKIIDEFTSGIEYNESVRQRLFRSAVGPIVTGAIAMAAFEFMKKDCDEWDEECLRLKYEEWSKRGYLRAYEQLLPYVFNGYIDDQFDQYGKLKTDGTESKTPAEYFAKTFNFTDAAKLYDVYSRYTDKNRMFEDNLFGTAFHLLNPPKYIQPYDYPEYRSAAIGQLAAGLTGARHLKAIDVFSDRLKAYGFAAGIYDPGMSAQEQKDNRKELYPKGYDEGMVNQILEKNLYRWYLEKYGHLNPDYKLKQSVEAVTGIGPKKSEKLAKYNIYSVEDMNGKTAEELLEFVDEKGRKIFQRKEAMAINNILNTNNSYGGTDFSDIGISSKGYEILKSIGYFSVGTNNVAAIKSDLSTLYSHSQDENQEEINQIFKSLEKVK